MAQATKIIEGAKTSTTLKLEGKKISWVVSAKDGLAEPQSGGGEHRTEAEAERVYHDMIKLFEEMALQTPHVKVT